MAICQALDSNELPVLYITYDGLTDPLGQSQILPYLTGINKVYRRITILSAEKPDNFSKNEKAVNELLSKTSIYWRYITYHRKPPVISTVRDLLALRKKAALICKEEQHIVHCRSYIAALAGLWLKRKYNAKLVFDMRGFWADERVDGGLWNLSNPLYRLIYNYFKRKEKEFFHESDAIVSLTGAGKKEICDKFGIQAAKIKVIPCCVDRKLFDPASISQAAISNIKNKLSINEGDFIITYLGSVGTWYMLEEMFDFFKRLKLVNPKARFLFVTNDPPAEIMHKAIAAGIQEKDLIIVNAGRKEVPIYLSISNIGLFFIKKVFSKIASSPTKMGEFLSMGIPVIGNNGVGDVEEIIEDCQCGLAVKSFDTATYDSCIAEFYRMVHLPTGTMTSAANKYFDLENGIEAYLEVYNNISGN